MSMRVVVDNERVSLRTATAADAPALHRLVSDHREEGRLLPRTLAELSAHASRFVAATRGGRVVGCAELAPLSARVAEIRSLVVDRSSRGHGLGPRMIDELSRRARLEGFGELCAFAHDAGFFVRLGFSIVPHTWVPEKIARDCAACPLFRACGQHALVLSLDEAWLRPTGTSAARSDRMLSRAH
jgi:amino-acid N-acetyltransferase